jgi:predicted RND superfamily exporter protein
MGEQGDSNGIWRTATLILTTALISLLTFLFLEGRNQVTKDDLKRAVENDSPYAKDQGQIKQHFDYTDRALEELKVQARDTITQLSELHGEVQATNRAVMQTLDGRAHGR